MWLAIVPFAFELDIMYILLSSWMSGKKKKEKETVANKRKKKSNKQNAKEKDVF